MYAGSPRALLHMEDPIERNQLLKLASGCVLTCSLMTHHSLLKVQHLVPENVVLGNNDVVPGVNDKLNSESTISKYNIIHRFHAYMFCGDFEQVYRIFFIESPNQCLL